MDEGPTDDELGYLGEYGVLIVPPTSEEGGWFVTLASWDEEAEAYGAGTDGPIVGTREEAMQEADRVLHWLKTQNGEGDLAGVWQQMQALESAEATGQQWPPNRDAWGRIIR